MAQISKVEVLRRALRVVGRYVPALAGATVEYSRMSRSYHIVACGRDFYFDYSHAVLWLGCVALSGVVERSYDAAVLSAVVASALALGAV